MTNNKLPYDVVYCSSQDPEHPISNLLGCTSRSNEESCTVHSLAGGGWQSEKNGKTTQTLILRFPGNVWLHQLRIVMHEVNRASRFEVSVFRLQGTEAFVNPPCFKVVEFVKLGSVNFSHSEESRINGRNSKMVHLKTEAYFIKLLFDQIVTGDSNRYNQVGVYAIECVGRLLTLIPFHADRTVLHSVDADSGNLGLSHSGVRLLEESLRCSHEGTDLALTKSKSTPSVRENSSRNFLLHQIAPLKDTEHAKDGVDPVMSIQSINLLMASTVVQPFRSVRIIEFEEFFLRRLEELFLLKDQASDLGDLETAKDCDDKLSELNKASRIVYRLEQSKVQAIIEEDFSRAEKARMQMDTFVENVYKSLNLPPLDAKADIYDASLILSKENSHRSQSPELSVGKVAEHISKLSSSRSSASTPRSNGFTRAADADDIRMTPSSASTHHRGGSAKTPEPRKPMSDLDDMENPFKVLEDAIRSFTGEGGADATLPLDTTLDTRMLRRNLGPYVSACLVSRNFKLREGALLVLTDHISTTLRGSAADAIDAMLRFLDFNSFGLQDAVPNVVFAACNFVRKSLADECLCISKYIPSLLNVLPRLLCRASEMNYRIRSEVMTTLELYIHTEKVPANAVFQAILADPIDREKRKVPSTNPRPQIIRLNLLKLLLSAGRLSLTTANGIHLIRKLLLPAVNHQNCEVRDTATGLFTSLVSQKYLALRDKDLNGITNSGIRQAIQAASES